MAASNMWKFTQRFSSLQICTPSCQPQRNYNMRSSLKKLGFPEKPKKPKGAFFRFRDEIKDDIIKKNPSMKQTEISMEASQRWKKLSKEQKDVYKNMCSVDMIKYQEDILRYQSSLTDKQKVQIDEAVQSIELMREGQKKRLKKKQMSLEYNKPKKPLTPYLRHLLTHSKPGMKMNEIAKIASTSWNNLPPNKKQKLEDEFYAEMEVYQRELEEWEKKMIRLGHVELVRVKTLCKGDPDRSERMGEK